MLNNSLKGSKVIFVNKNARAKSRLIENIQKPLVSFVIPVLNAEQTLAKCLDSILSQDYSNIEVVIVGNGSTDDTYEIAKAYERKYEGKVKVFRKLGPLGDVRTYGIEKSSGEFISLWDSDVYLPHTGWLTRAIVTFSQFPEASTLWIRTTPPPGAGSVAYAYEWFSWTIMLDFARNNRGFWGWHFYI